ncbi:MAG: hypothetical protein IVW57_19380, partial [Ktedonobacterales bacterium]|nr:hypothetical protein [Ktedonobacterales bacterium]
RGAGLSTAITLLVGLAGAAIASAMLLLASGPHLLGTPLWELGGLMFVAALLVGLSRWQGKRRQFARA